MSTPVNQTPAPEGNPITQTTIYVCQDCGEKHREDEVQFGRLYECIECSQRFTSEDGGGRYGALCPNCGNKPGQRIDAKAGTGSRYKKSEDAPLCPDCGTAECDEVEGFECDECAELFEDEEDAMAHVADQHQSVEGAE